MRAALTLHTPWAWDQASAVYCIFHFSGGVFSLARPPRNHRLPWAMVAGWVSKKNAKKAGIIVEKMGHLCQSTAVPRSSINRGRNLRLPWTLVAGRSSQLLVVGRKWRNRMFSERPGCSPHASSPWAWDQASAVYYNEERKRGREEEKKGRRRKMIVEKGVTSANLPPSLRERERRRERSFCVCKL